MLGCVGAVKENARGDEARWDGLRDAACFAAPDPLIYFGFSGSWPEVTAWPFGSMFGFHSPRAEWATCYRAADRPLPREVQLWWNRSRPQFSAEIRRRQGQAHTAPGTGAGMLIGVLEDQSGASGLLADRCRSLGGQLPVNPLEFVPAAV